MKAKLAIAGVLLVLSIPTPVQAQSQVGGLPVTNARVKALEDAIAVLQANLAAEISARQGLAASLAAETAARQAADAALQNAISNSQASTVNAINNEIAARQAADVTLQSAISNSQTSITALQGSITTIQSKIAQGPKTVVRVHSNFNHGVSDPINSAIVACAPGEKLTGEERSAMGANCSRSVLSVPPSPTSESVTARSPLPGSQKIPLPFPSMPPSTLSRSAFSRRVARESAESSPEDADAVSSTASKSQDVSTTNALCQSQCE